MVNFAQCHFLFTHSSSLSPLSLSSLSLLSLSLSLLLLSLSISLSFSLSLSLSLSLLSFSLSLFRTPCLPPSLPRGDWTESLGHQSVHHVSNMYVWRIRLCHFASAFFIRNCGQDSDLCAFNNLYLSCHMHDLHERLGLVAVHVCLKSKSTIAVIHGSTPCQTSSAPSLSPSHFLFLFFSLSPFSLFFTYRWSGKLGRRQLCAILMMMMN